MSPWAKGSRRVAPPSSLLALVAVLPPAPPTASAVVVPAVPAVAATPASAPVMVTDCCSSRKAGIQTLSSRTIGTSGSLPSGPKSKASRASFSSWARRTTCTGSPVVAPGVRPPATSTSSARSLVPTSS